MNKHLQTLEYNKILEKLREFTISEEAKAKARQLQLQHDLTICRNKIRESDEAKKIIETIGLPPLGSTDIVKTVLERAEIGDMLIPEQLEQIVYFLTAVRRMKSYLKRSEYMECGLSYVGREFQECLQLSDRIAHCIRGGEVDRHASSYLNSHVTELEKIRERIRQKLDQMLSSKKTCLSDHFVVQRNGHYVLPVKKECKNQVKGTVCDVSSSGNTFFIEPEAAAKLQAEAAIVEMEIDNETRRILYELTDEVWQAETELRMNEKLMAELDFVFAKGKLGIEMKAVAAAVTEEIQIEIRNGRHPLLEKEQCVPLNFRIGMETRGIVITGPNTGGKTVALKTVGLLTAMTAAGLLIPADAGTVCMLPDQILCDIGDGQNISESLSTFSAHMKNVISILKTANAKSLILLDELGSGTDPAEGMGIAVAILESLRKKNSTFVATTHYPEVKEYAKEAEGLLNARMTFDQETLQPKYQMVIGEAGESCALYIARKLGFPGELLEIARTCAYEETDWKMVGRNLKEEKYQQQKRKPKKPMVQEEMFTVGDSVMVLPSKEKGIVFRPRDKFGMVIVQVKGVKKEYAWKRVKLLVRAAEMYPEDYDFSIIFDTVENRKAKHTLGRKYDADVQVEYHQEL